MMRSGWLALVLTSYLLLTLAYGFVNPLFEAPDEHWHFFTTVYVKENGRLPITGPDTPENLLKQQAAQPPLSYVIGALLIAPIDTSRAAEQVRLNPHAAIGDASVLTNRNRAIHGPEEAWPWRGYALAAHLLRFFSTLLGLGTLMCIYGAGRLLWPGDPQPGLLATAVVAFLPQFNFLHAAISNDPLIIFLSSAAVYQLLAIRNRLVVTENQQGPITGVTYRLLLLGLTIGLAALSKNAGILLAVYAAGVVILLWLSRLAGGKGDARWGGSKQRILQSLIANLLYLIVPILLLSGWLWWRNWLLYGDPTATSEFVRFAGGDRQYSLGQALGESSGLWQSLFAIFGWFNLRPPDWVFWLWNGIVLLALIGGLREIRNWRFIANIQSPFLLLVIWVIIVYAGLLAFMLRTEAAQGRLLFPAILPLALGAAYGLSRWRWRRVYWLAPLLALATSLYSLLFVIAPAYARPPRVETLPPEAARLLVDLGEGLRLVGTRIETETAVPGDPIWLTLYWQAQQIPATPPAFKLEIFGRELERIADLHSYHGRGLSPADLWEPGDIVADRFGVYLSKEMATPVWGRIFVRLAEGTGPAVEVGGVKITPPAWPEAGTILAQVGDAVGITAVSLAPAAVRPGDTIFVEITWLVLTPVGKDLTTLLHLGDAGQPPLAQGDSPPLAGEYPTSLWAAGEVVPDRYKVVVGEEVANGRYPLWIGLYDPDTLVRLPLSAAGERQPFDVFQIGTVIVHHP